MCERKNNWLGIPQTAHLVFQTFQGNKPSAGAIIKLKTWERMGSLGVFCEDQNRPWRPRTLGSDYVPEESKEGTLQKSMQRNRFEITSAQPMETEQRQVGRFTMWENQLTFIKVSSFAQLPQPTRFAYDVKAVATSPFVSFLSASTQHEQGTCGEPRVQSWIPCLGRECHWPPHRPSYLPGRRVGPRGATHCCCVGMLNHERSSHKTLAAQMIKNAKIWSCSICFFFLCMSNPSMVKRDLTCKSLISMHTRYSTVLVGMSEKHVWQLQALWHYKFCM